MSSVVAIWMRAVGMGTCSLTVIQIYNIIFLQNKISSNLDVYSFKFVLYVFVKEKSEMVGKGVVLKLS